MKHLFIVGMHNGGTTMFDNMLKRCKNVVPLKKEGCAYFSKRKDLGPFDMHFDLPRLCTEKLEIFGNEESYAWPAIKSVWMNDWQNHHKFKQTNNPVLLEKSPSVNIFVAPFLDKYFENAHFLLSIRNPYAIVEGMYRRNWYDWKLDWPKERYARHWLRCAVGMKELQLGGSMEVNNKYWFKYEEFCADPAACIKFVKAWIPELDDLHTGPIGGVHYIGQKNQQPIPPTNFNQKQFDNLTNEDLEAINSVLDERPDILEYFGYERANNVSELR